MSWYAWTTVIPLVLSLYVMQKTEHDQINKVTPGWLAWMRRGGFVFMASALCDVWLENASWRSLFLIYISGVISLGINALALHLRAKSNKTGVRYPVVVRRRSF